MKRACYLGLALVALGIGLVGIVVPGLPTVVFMLVAAWAASKSHPGLHRWLRNNPHFGEHVRHWEDHRTMPARAKCYAYAALLLAALVGVLSFTGWWLAGYVLVLAGVVAYIASIPASDAGGPRRGKGF